MTQTRKKPCSNKKKWDWDIILLFYLIISGYICNRFSFQNFGQECVPNIPPLAFPSCCACNFTDLWWSTHPGHWWHRWPHFNRYAFPLNWQKTLDKTVPLVPQPRQPHNVRFITMAIVCDSDTMWILVAFRTSKKKLHRAFGFYVIGISADLNVLVVYLFLWYVSTVHPSCFSATSRHVIVTDSDRRRSCVRSCDTLCVWGFDSKSASLKPSGSWILLIVCVHVFFVSFHDSLIFLGTQHFEQSWASGGNIFVRRLDSWHLCKVFALFNLFNLFQFTL